MKWLCRRRGVPWEWQAIEKESMLCETEKSAISFANSSFVRVARYGSG
jgi:hypothetical protein